MKRVIQIAATVVLVVGVGARPAAAFARIGQVERTDSTSRDGRVVGRVLDANTGVPLKGAVVAVEPLPAGVFPAASGGPAFLSATRSAVTDGMGRYRFDALPSGHYRIAVRRLGYQATMIELDLRSAAPIRVSVGLEVAPIRLEPVEATSAPLEPFVRSQGDLNDAEWRRVGAVQDRQARFLPSDVRSVTNADVDEAVSLGETDILRAVQRFPGVWTRDDYTAELWTRGAPWSHTKVYFDGVPMFGSLHTFGALSGVNADAVGAAFFQPGVRSASRGEGTAGVLELQSRRGGSANEVQGAAGLSLISGRTTIDGPLGRGGWMVSGRRSIWDALAVPLNGSFPYAFYDMTGRVDVPAGRNGKLAASGVWLRDQIRGNLGGYHNGNKAGWGSALGQVTYETPRGSFYTRTRIGVSQATNSWEVLPFDPSAGCCDVPHQPSSSRLMHLEAGTDIGPLAGDHATSWSAGLSLVAQRYRYDGAPPDPYGVLFSSTRAPGTAVPIVRDTLRMREDPTFAALWGEKRLLVWEHLALQAGMRVEVGDNVTNGGEMRWSPRLSARYRVAGSPLTLSTGFGRSYQYTQILSGTGPDVLGGGLSASDVWLLAGDTVPAIQSDVATAGGEYWLGGGWLSGVNVYSRRAGGVAIPDPRPGLVTGRPLFVRAINRARGAELSLRKLMGRWTGSVGYSYGISEMEAVGLKFPAATEQRHLVSATAIARLSRSTRIGAAYARASGTPYTRVLDDQIACDSIGCGVAFSAAIGAPNARRGDPYASLDLLFDWTRSYRKWTLGWYIHVRNITFRQNRVVYATTYVAGVQGLPGIEIHDGFRQSLGFFPSLGVRISF